MALSDFLSKPTEYITPAYPADITLTVSEEGGLSLEQAWQRVAELRKCSPEKSVTIRVKSGEYHTQGLHITSEMSGSKAAPVTMVAENGVILNGGVTLRAEDFSPPSAEIKARLHGDAKEKVICVDLKKYGLTAEQWGKICAVGYHTAEKYDDGAVGITAEIFCNSKRMHLARWPNQGSFAKLDEVADVGDCREFPPQNYYDDWMDRRNHRAGIYIISPEDNKRVATWKDPEDAWVFGYFMWDWSDSSTPITLDTAHRRFFPKYVSYYGVRKGCDFYFFNILEELDEPGEYYLDRKEGILYLYPEGEAFAAKIEMSLAINPAISVENASDITIDGFTVCNIRENGIVIKGNRVAVKNCIVTNAASYGIMGEGFDITVEHCEICHTGRGGVKITSGDRPSLTPGGCEIINNYIHSFAEVYQTYAAGVEITGVGSHVAHNEISFTPHAAILYYGNDHLIEYNYLHDVVRYSADAGAIYSGQDWTAMGTVIRRNVLERVGSEQLKPSGIYWDDGLSGQTAYENVLIGIGDRGFHIGGGFNQLVCHNIIFDAKHPISYDARNYDGLNCGGWCHAAVETKGKGNWSFLTAMPIRSPLWTEHYPVFKLLREDLENKSSWLLPEFPTNPARSKIFGNICIRHGEETSIFAPPVLQYSYVENNIELSPLEKGENPGFVSLEMGDYRLKDEGLLQKALPDFPKIPFELIGRY